ncbi:MAG TPA: hypothetical protein PKH24_21285 [Sedimentisphaerales bacterium]|nr:hypothetical protein [Sedimentisphaerales bacterium]
MAICIVAVLASMTQASVTVVTSPANPQQTTAVATYQTFGDTMDGLVVTVNGTDSAVWADTGAGAGAASGSGWTLAESGDTWDQLWTLSSDIAITRLMIDAGAGDTMFDIVNGADLTPNSAYGRPFTLVNAGNYPGDILVTYSGPVSLIGDSFYGDLYRYMTVAFSDEFVGTLTFQTDTDNAFFPDDIEPTIPAPGALLLAGIGAAMLRSLRKRQAV